MNPQDNASQNGNAAPGGTPNFDGFGGPNITYENYSEPKPVQQQAPQPQQSINVVNANGVISGRRMVDYLWQRIAYCALAFSGVLLIGLIVSVVFVGIANTNKATFEAEKTSINNSLKGLYEIMGVDSQEEMVKALNEETHLMNGGDWAKVDKLLIEKFGAAYRFDLASTGINEIRLNNMYKVVSLGVQTPTGTERAVLYGNIASGEWKMASFNAADPVDPCANSSDEEKSAISGIFKCGEPMVKADDGDKENEEPEE